jgi:hypothetical protein
MKNKQMKKTGELREFLLNSINQVASGEMEEAEARNIIKLAGQVNESLYAEVKVTNTKLELGQVTDSFGKLDLT